MEHPIVYHLSQCGCALGLGLGLGLWYDVLRGGRRASLRGGWAFDLLFAVTLFPALWLFGLSIGGGQFEFFFYPLGFLGWMAYELGISPRLRPGFYWVFSIIFRALRKILKKTAKLQKNCFSFWSKWGRIGYKYSLARKQRKKQRRWPV